MVVILLLQILFFSFVTMIVSFIVANVFIFFLMMHFKELNMNADVVSLFEPYYRIRLREMIFRSSQVFQKKIEYIHSDHDLIDQRVSQAKARIRKAWQVARFSFYLSLFCFVVVAIYPFVFAKLG